MTMIEIIFLLWALFTSRSIIFFNSSSLNSAILFNSEEDNFSLMKKLPEKENAGYRYDAKEKGNGHYEKEERKKKDKKQQKADNVYLKPQVCCLHSVLKYSRPACVVSFR